MVQPWLLEQCPQCGESWRGEAVDPPVEGRVFFLRKATLLEEAPNPPTGVKCWTCKKVFAVAVEEGQP